MREDGPRGRGGRQGNVVHGRVGGGGGHGASASLWAGGIAIAMVLGVAWLSDQPSQAIASSPGNAAIRASFTFCDIGGGTNCVVDGDTIWLGGEKIRVADIDAPETHDPRCAEERALGDRATRRLQALLNGGAVSLEAIDRDEDRYGRKLRIVLVDGANVGDTLVSEGLARRYSGGRRPWC